MIKADFETRLNSYNLNYAVDCIVFFEGGRPRPRPTIKPIYRPKINVVAISTGRVRLGGGKDSPARICIGKTYKQNNRGDFHHAR